MVYQKIKIQRGPTGPSIPNKQKQPQICKFEQVLGNLRGFKWLDACKSKKSQSSTVNLQSHHRKRGQRWWRGYPLYCNSIVPLLERGSPLYLHCTSPLYLSIVPPLYLYIVPLHNILFHRNSQAMVEAVSAVFRVICTLLHCVV